MDIEKIIPYERNARNNKKAIPVVAESIKEFGLRGQIVLESRDNPVIVTGHTRVEACKRLGWTEIPDENIAYCDGLTDDQIKAYRLADNKTAEVATWNKGLLKSEMKQLDKSSFDMSRFNFDWKSKQKDFIRGQEAFKTAYTMNLHLVNIYDTDGEYEFPILEPVDFKPTDLTSFNYCKSATDFNCGVHFCIDDYQFERVWNKPEKYLDLLKRFECVVTPDFSVYIDMPYPMKLWNVYRSRALGNYWQRNGLTVIPNVTWCQSETTEYMLEGIPKGGTIFISTIGVQRAGVDDDLLKGMDKVTEIVKPSRVLLLGTSFGHDFGGAEICKYKTRAFNDSTKFKGNKNGKA